jgi:anaerobic selenocysteine-containing dehydrogenase
MRKAKSRRRSLVHRAESLIRQWDGKLTQELVLHPDDFGLGKVPARLVPDDATDMVCGFLNATDREKIAQLLRISVEKIPSQNSWAYDQIVQGMVDGKIKGLWVIATNSSHSWINQREFNEIVKKLDFLVVQDMYHTTETAQRAHLILPAAGWGEKTGTFINSERRIGIQSMRCFPAFCYLTALSVTLGLGYRAAGCRSPSVS